MTLAPIDSIWLVRGTAGPPYRVGPYCSNPDCRRIAEHAHHIFRRSALGGDYTWVEIPDEQVVVGNLTGLCPRCHDAVTGVIGGHTAAIRYEDGTFLWCEVEERESGFVTFLPIGELDPQPPTPDSLAARASAEPESETCPTCGQRRRRPSSPVPAGGRRRKTWGMDVPDDHEDGADVLDALADDLALKLGYHNERSRLRRYHAVWHALVFTEQNLKLFIQQLAGRGA